MSADLNVHTFTTKINGTDCDIKIKTDLTWGETQELLTKSVRILENELMKFSPTDNPSS